MSKRGGDKGALINTMVIDFYLHQVHDLEKEMKELNCSVEILD